MSESTWNEMHSEPKMELDCQYRTVFSKGGVAHFGIAQFQTPEAELKKVEKYWMNNGVSEDTERIENYCRDGFFGWYGYGGAVMQWNPELKIGIGYLPFDHFSQRKEIGKLRSSRLQKAVAVIVKEKMLANK